MEEAKRNVSVPVIAAILLGAALLAAVLFLGNTTPRRPSTPVLAKLPPMGAVEQKYAAAIAVSDLELSQFENFLGQTVTYVEGRSTNRGTRSIAALELTFEFKDLLNQTILRETVRVIDPRSTPLGPGLARPFRTGFDNIPADWDHRAPEIRVTGLVLQ